MITPRTGGEKDAADIAYRHSVAAGGSTSDAFAAANQAIMDHRSRVAEYDEALAEARRLHRRLPRRTWRR